ncbi:ATP-dependent DNA ligase [Sistotremastrum niveocremeum HHB9708]|uniref:DNA ligase n=1 Tax=Sistotremastrum niveocremeum HHB9708 TaxID=1314777 RepID=A0A165A3K4_9AGAM|nr:ATP-dependent DNA ligase [Sistotremastrum niveocremeum HHB9708]
MSPSKRPATTSSGSPAKRPRQGDLLSFFSPPSARVASVIVIDDDDEPSPPPSKRTEPGRLPADPFSIKPVQVAVPNAQASNALLPLPSLTDDPLVFALPPCPWATLSSAPYAFLAHTLASLAETRSRITILNVLTNSLRILSRYDPPSLLPSIYLLSNSLSPPYDPLELNLGPSIISRAIQNVSGLSPAALKKLYTSTGDPGDVAFAAKAAVRTLKPHPLLLISAVYSALQSIARASGTGAVKQRQSIAEKLLLSAKGEEARYIARTLSQHIRVGATRTTVLTALARALVLTPPASIPTSSDHESPFYASPADLIAVKPLPVKGKGKASAPPDPVRESILIKFARSEALIKQVFVQHPNYDHILDAILNGGLENLAERVPLTVGIPLHHTLGSPSRSLDEVYERLGDLPFVAEFKYDGQRAQIHAFRDSLSQKTTIKLFSRHLEDMTLKYPDICALVELILGRSQINSFIIDAEIVAIDTATGDLQSFQTLSNRPRKDVQLKDVKVSVCVYAFDLMYLDGTVLLKEPFRRRRELLRNTFPPLVPDQVNVARLDHVESIESEVGRSVVEEFWQQAVDGKSEGLMIKLLDTGTVIEEDVSKGKTRRKPLPATYEPDKRTLAWIKLKKDYVTGLGDSLDVVPIGAWHGNGRKAAWWSPVLLGLWDEGQGRLVAVCKCMSGFSDAFYKALNERYPANSETCSPSPLWDVETGGFSPSVYFKPMEVWEIRGADITQSPVSTAALGLVSQDRGLSLRFPRFIRVRDDKGITNANTPEFLVRLWKTQEARGKKVVAGVDDGDLVDVDMSDNGDDEGDSNEE